MNNVNLTDINSLVEKFREIICSSELDEEKAEKIEEEIAEEIKGLDDTILKEIVKELYEKHYKFCTEQQRVLWHHDMIFQNLVENYASPLIYRTILRDHYNWEAKAYRQKKAERENYRKIMDYIPRGVETIMTDEEFLQSCLRNLYIVSISEKNVPTGIVEIQTTNPDVKTAIFSREGFIKTLEEVVARSSKTIDPKKNLDLQLLRRTMMQKRFPEFKILSQEELDKLIPYGDILEALDDNTLEQRLRNAKGANKLIENLSDYELLKLSAMKKIDNKTFQGWYCDRKMQGRVCSIILEQIKKDTENNIQNEDYRGVLLGVLEKLLNTFVDKSKENFFQLYRRLDTENKSNGLFLNGQDVLKLAKRGLIDDIRLIDVFDSEKLLKSARAFPKIFEDGIITPKQYLEHFTLDKIIHLLEAEKKENEETGSKNESRVERFIKGIQSFNKDEKYESELVQKYIQANPTTSKKELEDILLNLHKRGILELKTIMSHISSEGIAELYCDGELSIEDIAFCFSEKIIDRKTFVDLINGNEGIRSYIKDGDIKIPTLLTAYMNGHFGIEDMKEVFTTDDLLSSLREKILEMKRPEEAQKQQEYLLKIEELCMGELVDFDTLENLKEHKKISEDEFKDINEKRAIKEIKQLSEIKNIAISEEKAINGGKGGHTGGNNKRPKYMELINALGESKQIPIIVGALQGYKFILLEDMRVVLLEKLKQGNATYVIPLLKGVNLATGQNKQNLRGQENVFPVNHTGNWAFNLLGRIEEVQKQTLHSNRHGITYANNLLKDDRIKGLCNELKASYQEYTREKGANQNRC